MPKRVKSLEPLKQIGTNDIKWELQLIYIFLIYVFIILVQKVFLLMKLNIWIKKMTISLAGIFDPSEYFAIEY